MKPGDRIDRYLVEALLGEGGMGAVYRAHDDRLQRRVALKVVRSGALHDPQADSRMLKEARAAAALDHPNAINIFDVAPFEGGMYIAMEFIQGRSMRAFVGDPSVPLDERIRWLTEVARALGAAHRRGIIHRDIKPENVMIRDDGVVKVLDFGIARRTPTADSATGAALSTATGAGVMAGTPFYMAPEQLRCETLDGRTDQFAWGVTAFELLAGERPFGAGLDPMSAIAAILGAGPTPSLLGRPGIPSPVAEAVDRALRKEPRDRFSTMEEAADALAGAKSAGSGDAMAYAATAALQPSAIPSTSAAVAASASLPQIGSRAGRGRVVAIATILAVAAVISSIYFVTRNKLAGSPSAFASVSASATARTMLVSSDPRARHDFEVGEQAFRQGSTALAWRHFEAAQKADPGVALAHLRMALIDVQTSPTFAREHFQLAWQARDRMEGPDRALAEAAEPYLLRDDLAEWEKRLESACGRYPLDGVLRHYLAVARAQRGNLQGAREAIDDAVAVEPSLGLAWLRKGRLHFLAGDEKAAQDAYDRCVALAPSATDCLEQRAKIEARAGRCQEALRDVQALVNADPQADDGYYLRGVLLAGMGKPRETVLAALQQRWARIDDAQEKKEAELTDRIAYAEWIGDFDEAVRLGSEWASLVGNAPDVIEHAAPAATLCEVHLEEGRAKEAGRIAQAFLTRIDALSPVHTEQDLSFLFVESLYRAATIGKAEYERRREVWFRNPQLRWLHGHAIPARDEQEASAALAVLEDPSELPKSQVRGIETDAALGRVYVLAGKADEAMPYLEAATRTCSGLTDPIAQTQAYLYLGSARAARGDSHGACEAWSLVLQRWGSAKPASRTAQEARKRAKDAGCEKR